MVAPLWVNRDYLTTIDLRSAYWQLSPLTMQNLVALKKCRRYPRSKICAKVHQNRLRTCYPLRTPIIPNFIEIGQTSLEKSVTKIGPRTKKFLFVTDGQKRDYLSRDSQRARGATKNSKIYFKFRAR